MGPKLPQQLVFQTMLDVCRFKLGTLKLNDNFLVEMPGSFLGQTSPFYHSQERDGTRMDFGKVCQDHPKAPLNSHPKKRV